MASYAPASTSSTSSPASCRTTASSRASASVRPPGNWWRTVIRMDSGKSGPACSRTIRIISVANVARPRTSPPNRSVRVFQAAVRNWSVR